MARVTVNYRYLFQLVNDINIQSENSPAFRFLNRSKISRFRADNALQLKLMENHIAQLVDAHAMHDAHNKPVIENGQWKFLTEEAKQAYQDKLNQFLDRETFLIE